MVYFYSCVFTCYSPHSHLIDIRRFVPYTNQESLTKSFPTVLNTFPPGWPSREVIVDNCRVLMNKVFVEEYKWIPDMSLNTGYNYRSSTLLPGNPIMLCDRFDNSALWVVILSETIV